MTYLEDLTEDEMEAAYERWVDSMLDREPAKDDGDDWPQEWDAD